MNSGKAMQKSGWRLSTGERRILLIVGDLLSAYLGLIAALYFWAQKDAWFHFSMEFLRSRPPAWFYLLPFLWVILMVDLYDIRRAGRRKETLQGIGAAALICVMLYLIVYFTSEPNSLPRRGIAFFILFASALTLAWRMIYIQIFTAPMFLRRVLIIGAGLAGSTLAKALKEIHPSPFQIIGFVDDDIEKQGKLIQGFPVLCRSGDLLKVIGEQNISELIFAITVEINPGMLQSLLMAEEQGIEVSTYQNVYEEHLNRIPIFLLQSDWLVRSFVDQYHTGGFFQFGKRLVDIIGAFIGSLLLIVILPFIYLAIIVESGRPVFFKQTRLGKNGREYTITKFRTMIKDAEGDGKARMAQENDERVTRLGKVLRKSHLDELPQFLNVLKGEMSLVGPRAERPEFVDHLQKRIPFYRARLFVKPGLTGWAQVNQRYAATVEETGVKLEYDLYYIKNQNLFLDLYILLKTVGQVFGLKGI
jgi:exopolysaccharide biosynthesis polyprenyl glycosylphosphotransferase